MQKKEKNVKRKSTTKKKHDWETH